MRTIIINTLGDKLRQNPLFYLSFPSDQFYWIEKPLEKIEECVDQLCLYNDTLETRQSCHLVVLVSLAPYELARYEKLRAAHKQVIFAHLNTKLLIPLVRDRKQQLIGASVVFVLPQPTEGTGGIPLEDINFKVLRIDPRSKIPDCVALTDDNGVKTVDLTACFKNILNDFRSAKEQIQNHGMTKDESSGLNSLRRAIEDKLKELQVCRYLRPGDETQYVLSTEQLEFRVSTDDWDLFCIDLHINLSEHLQKNLGSSLVWKLELVSHDAQDIRERIQLAIARVLYLRQNTPRLAFFALEADINAQQSIVGEIWKALTSGDTLPGVAEAYTHAQLEEACRESAISKEKSKLAKKLRHSWLLVGLEKKRFESYYDTLQEQYAPEAAAKQQQNVLDICANTFAEWRRKLLTRKITLPAQAKESELPVFDQVARQKEIARAQQQWGEAAVDQLEDYTDVREKAEQVKAQFRKAYRLWPDGEFNATSKFCVYSIVLALLFILQMLLPYIGITMGQDGVELSRYVHFFLSLLMFVGLYAVGALIWMQALCKQLETLSDKMFWLLQDSHFRRRQSIIRAVEAYGQTLPRCALCHERLQMLQMIHEENLQRKERFNSHAQLLSKADELLHELRSLLRMPEGISLERIEIQGGINFELAPSHPENMPYYAFLSEKWGRS